MSKKAYEECIAYNGLSDVQKLGGNERRVARSSPDRSVGILCCAIRLTAMSTNTIIARNVDGEMLRTSNISARLTIQ